MVRKRGREGGRRSPRGRAVGGHAGPRLQLWPLARRLPMVCRGLFYFDGLFLSHADVNVIRKQSGSGRGRAWLSVELHQKRAVQFNSKDVTLLRQY